MLVTYTITSTIFHHEDTKVIKKSKTKNKKKMLDLSYDSDNTEEEYKVKSVKCIDDSSEKLVLQLNITSPECFHTFITNPLSFERLVSTHVKYNKFIKHLESRCNALKEYQPDFDFEYKVLFDYEVSEINEPSLGITFIGEDD